MLAADRQRLTQDIGAWVEQYGSTRSALLPVLQEVQQKYHQVSDFAMQEIADRLDIHPVEVFSVVTFYAFLNHESRGTFVFRLCRTISCDMAGKDRVARQLESVLGITFGQTTGDGNFSLEWASCTGMCDQGPALLVNDQVFTRVTPEKVNEIVAECHRNPSTAATHGDESREAHV